MVFAFANSLNRQTASPSYAHGITVALKHPLELPWQCEAA